MPPLSEYASVILDRMESDRSYEPQDLQVFVPDATVERLREIMQELWINRHVERVGYSGWRRYRSAPPHCPHEPPPDERSPSVKPDDLFDHATFTEFFK